MRYAPVTIILKTKSEAKITVTRKMVCDTLPFQDASTHQIWNSYLKYYKRYAPDTIILKVRSEAKVTVTRKMVCNTPPSKDTSTHQIWNSYLKEYKRYAPDTIILKTRSEVKVTVTQKLYVTLCHTKMHLHTELGFPISKHIGDMHQTQFGFYKLGQRSKSKSQ